MPSVSLSATPLNSELFFVFSILCFLSVYPESILLPLSFTLATEHIQEATIANGKPSSYSLTNRIAEINQRAGLKSLSNACPLGGSFNMAAATAARSGKPGIFWTNGGELTPPIPHLLFLNQFSLVFDLAGVQNVSKGLKLLLNQSCKVFISVRWLLANCCR